MGKPFLPYLLHGFVLVYLTVGTTLFAMAVESSGFPEALSESISRMNKMGQFNGVVLVAQDGRVIYREALGVSDIVTELPLAGNSVFEIASITKTFTAVAIHQLVERSEISYKDSLVKFFPLLSYDRVTIEGLLGHTSGMIDVYEDHELRELFYRFYDRTDKPYSNTDYLKFLLAHQPPLLGQPGEKFRYSNTGYVLLGLVIEKVTGRSYEDYVKSNILSIAKMDNTHMLSDRDFNSIPGIVKGYELLKTGQFYEVPNTESSQKVTGLTYADDEMVSTVDDLLAFDQALRSGKLLSPETLRRAYTPVALADGRRSYWGLGFAVDTQNDPHYVSHSGGTTGYRSFCQFSTDSSEFTFVVLANMAGGDYQLSSVTKEIRRILKMRVAN